MPKTLTPAHDLLTTPHAFNCAQVHGRAYAEAVDSEQTPVEALRLAAKTHDNFVSWVFENCPLN